MVVKKINSFIKGDSIVIKKHIATKVLTWVLGGSLTVVNVIYYFAKSNANQSNELKEIKELTIQNHADNVEMKKIFNAFAIKVYNDGYSAFNDYQEYSKKQFELIIKYGLTNKTLLNDVLEMNHVEQMNKMKKNLEKSKTNISSEMKLENDDSISSKGSIQIKMSPYDIDSAKNGSLASAKE